MSDFLHVELCEGKRVRDPMSGKYMLQGQDYKVPRTQFWFRRLEDGSIKLFESSEMEEKVSDLPKKKVSRKRREKEES